MHVAFVSLPTEFYSPQTGGAFSTCIMELGRCLQARGHQVSVLAPAPRHGEIEHEVGRVHHLNVPLREDLSLLQRARCRLSCRINRWDWPYYNHYLRSVTRTLRGLASPPDVVVTCNDLVAPTHIRRILPQARIFSWLQNECFTHPDNISPLLAATDLFLTCSGYVSRWTQARYNIAEGRIAVLGNGVSLDRFAPRAGALGARTPLQTLFIGRVDPNKGPDLAVDAVTTLRRQGAAITFTAAGGVWFYPRPNDVRDPFLLALQAKVQALSDAGRCLGHVTRDRVPALVRAHDIAFVLSRSQEPFGLVVLEAMASGLAVIASNRGGIPEAAGGAALLVDPDRPEEILAALRKLVDDPVFLVEQKRKSLARAQAAGWPIIADRLLAFCTVPLPLAAGFPDGAAAGTGPAPVARAPQPAIG